MADPMEWFVNRLKQLQGFQKMTRGETDKCIMAIRAPAEMGKSWLIQRMRQRRLFRPGRKRFLICSRTNRAR